MQRLLEILFNALISSELGPHIVHSVAEFPFHHIVIDSYGVHPCLHEEEFGGHHLLQDITSSAFVGHHSVCPHHLHLFLQLRNGDHLIAYDSNSLVHDSVRIFLS